MFGEVVVKSIISAWLWSLSWGWYHIPVNTVLLILLFIFVGRLSIIRSVFCSLLFTFGAFILLTVIALGVGVWGYQLAYASEEWGPVLNDVQISFYLGFLYTILQIGFYVLVRKLTNKWVPLLLFIGNMITATVIVQLLPVNLF